VQSFFLDHPQRTEYDTSLDGKDVSAFAGMILKAAYPQQNFPVANQFFYSPLKRRLAMIIKNQHSKAGYLTRLLALPVCFLIISAFTVKTKLLNPTFNPFYNGEPVTVIIDAGHGGNDFGAQNAAGTYFEKNISLELVKAIQDMNKNKNIHIVLSRNNDMYVSPTQRVDFTKEKKADLFISIHLGASDNKHSDNSGLAVFVAKNEFSNTEKSKMFASVLINEFKINYQLPVTANPVQRERNIWVLQANECPAVLIEAGFIDNKTDLDFLNSEKGKQSIAMNILKAIEKYADSKTNFKDAAESEKDAVSDTLKIIAKKFVIQNNSHPSPDQSGSFEGNFQGANKDSLKMMVVINGKKMDNRMLKNVTINSKFAKIYADKNNEAIQQYGGEAANGVIVFEQAVIEKNKDIKNNSIIVIDSAVVLGIVNKK
jgi:N-acetylmuramoyl-L-alanine amidase